MDILVGVVLAVLIIAVIGFLVHLITTKIPMDDSIKQGIAVFVVVVVVLWILAVIVGQVSLPTLPAFR